jgi:hypothetical protein
MTPRHLMLCRLLYMIMTASIASACAADAAHDGAPANDEWRLSPTPVFSIAEPNGDPDLVLHGVRFGALLQDGQMVVSSALTTLMFFDTAGHVVRVVGGHGDGPGEFGRIDGLHGGDRGLVIIDHDAGRASVFTFQGDFVRTLSPPFEYSRIRGFDPAAGGIITSSRAAPGEPIPFRVWDTEGTLAFEFQGPPAPPSAIAVSFFPGPPQRGATTFGLPLSCTGAVLTAVVDSAIYLVDTLEGTVLTARPAALPIEMFRTSYRPRITAEMQAALRRSLSSAPQDTVERVIRRIGEVGDPLPSWSAVIADPTGRLWLQRAECPALSSGDGMWDIVSVKGEPIGTFSMPDSLSVRAVRGHHMLVVRRDSLEVEHLELYRVLPSSNGRLN